MDQDGRSATSRRATSHRRRFRRWCVQGVGPSWYERLQHRSYAAYLASTSLLVWGGPVLIVLLVGDRDLIGAYVIGAVTGLALLTLLPGAQRDDYRWGRALITLHDAWPGPRPDPPPAPVRFWQWLRGDFRKLDRVAQQQVPPPPPDRVTPGAVG